MDEHSVMYKDIIDDVYNEIKFRVVLLGDNAVGKTSICYKLINKNEETLPTIGCAMHHYKKQLSDTRFTVELWDTAGHRSYNATSQMCYRSSHIVIIVYDVTNLSSFEVAKEWAEDLKAEDRKYLTYFIGNKVDLPNREVVKENAEAYAKNNSMIYAECSALSGYNIINIFDNVIDNAIIMKIPRLPNQVTALRQETSPALSGETKSMCVLL